MRFCSKPFILRPRCTLSCEFDPFGLPRIFGFFRQGAPTHSWVHKQANTRPTQSPHSLPFFRRGPRTGPTQDSPGALQASGGGAHAQDPRFPRATLSVPGRSHAPFVFFRRRPRTGPTLDSPGAPFRPQSASAPACCRGCASLGGAVSQASRTRPQTLPGRLQFGNFEKAFVF